MLLHIIELWSPTEPREKFPDFSAETLTESGRPSTICLLVCEIEISGAAKARVLGSEDNSQPQSGNVNIFVTQAVRRR